jgi:uncharacterized membrane protein (UPF0127 family)
VIVVLAVTVVFIFSRKDSPTIRVGEKRFNLYVAETEVDKQIGLSKYEKISNNRGMLFVFDKPEYYPFWMKGMKFPIDIIYIKGDKVVTVIKDLKPENSDSIIYYPIAPSDKVLEINAGLAAEHGIDVGETVKLENI